MPDADMQQTKQSEPWHYYAINKLSEFLMFLTVIAVYLRICESGVVCMREKKGRSPCPPPLQKMSRKALCLEVKLIICLKAPQHEAFKHMIGFTSAPGAINLHEGDRAPSQVV